MSVGDVPSLGLMPVVDYHLTHLWDIPGNYK